MLKVDKQQRERQQITSPEKYTLKRKSIDYQLKGEQQRVVDNFFCKGALLLWQHQKRSCPLFPTTRYA